MTPTPHTTPLWIRIGAPLFALALRLLGATWRLRVSGHNPLDDFAVGASPANAPIGIAWHSGALILAYCFRDLDVTVGVSQSRDGESISAALLRLGFAEPVRGSTSRGGAEALRQLIARANDGRPVALLVDGPRGPAHRAKPGAIILSRRAGRALTPLGCDASAAIRFGSWDRTILPLPFARVAIHFGEPIPPPDPTGDIDTMPLDDALRDTQDVVSRVT